MGVEEDISLVPESLVQEIEENRQGEKEVNVNEAESVEENARVPEVECCETGDQGNQEKEGERESAQGERESEQGERESDQDKRESEQGKPEEVSSKGSETQIASEVESETAMEVDLG